MRRVFLLFVMTSFLLCPSLMAQSIATAQIAGTVKDSSGAVLPGAEVKVIQTDTNYNRAVVSNEAGNYLFPNLPIGPYRLEVAMQGFSTYVQTGIVLQVNSNPTIQVTLKIGELREIVEVQAAAAMVETQSTGVGQVIDSQRVVELPLNGRDISQLIALSGAAVAHEGAGIKSNLNHPDAVAYSVAGGLDNATNYVLDGGAHIDPRTNVGMPLPFPEATEEFKVETSALPANYGSQPGGAVNVVTKSGTNRVTGTLFWFARNYVLNARNFFAATRDSLKRNQFGGTIGGPIIKDKVFYFVGLQGTTLRQLPTPRITYVPTAAMLQGDFRTWLAPPCKSRQYNLVSTLDGKPFATGNVIDKSWFSPIAMKWIAMIPVSSDACGEFRFSIPNETNAWQIMSRGDWRRNQADSIFIRYYITDSNQKSYIDPKNIMNTAVGYPDRAQSVIIGDTYVINPKLVSTSRLSYSRSAVQRLPPEGIPTPTQLGSKVTSMTPNFTGQGWPLGGSGLTGYVYTNVYNASENVGWTMGAHQLSFGFEWVQTQMNGLGTFQMNPGWTFNGTITQDSVVDFMVGKPASIRQGGGQWSRDVRNAPNAFLQDNWKISQQLQVNIGIRWDPYVPSYNKFGYAMRFERDKFNSKTHTSQKFALAPPGISVPGDAGWKGKSTTEAIWNLFSPRIGLVYDPSGKGDMTIRLGYGWFYGSTYLWSTQHVPLNPPWGDTVTNSNPVGGLADPWSNYQKCPTCPFGDPFPPPKAYPTDTPFLLNGTYVFENWANNFRPYTQQWNLALQKQLGPNWMVSASYIGNNTHHQTLGIDINPAPYIPGNCVAGQYGLTKAGACSTTGNIPYRRILYLQDPANGQYLGAMDMEDPNGNASYNGLILSANHRFANNFSLLANHTWSHCFNQGEPGQDIGNFYQDLNNRRAEWGPCSSDRRHLTNISFVTRSPKFESKSLQALLGNWGFSGIINLRSGRNVTVGPSSLSPDLTGIGNRRANLIGDWRVDKPSYLKWFNGAAFADPALGQLGNMAPSIQMYGPGAWNFDASFSRTFQLLEKLRTDFKLEMFNVFNHTRFGNPTTSQTSVDYMKIMSASDPRIMQVSLKINF